MPSMSIARTAALSVLLSACLTSATDGCSNSLSVSYPAPVAADGWTYRLIANGLTKPRGIAFDKDGGLLIVDAGVGLKHLTLADNGGTCLSVTDNKTLIADKNLNHGLALSNDGNTIYVSSSASVFSFAYDSKAINVDISSNQTIVANMSGSDHTTRTLLISNKQPGTLIVSRGSTTNQDSLANNITSGHSQIRSYDLSKVKKGDAPYEFLDGHVLGWGLRNSVGVAEDPSTGGIWSVENSVDSLSRKGKDIHENNPAEELNYHGVLSSTQKPGGNYGYPVCYAIWSTQNFPDVGSLTVGQQFPDDSAPSTLSDSDCNTKYIAPRNVFTSHTAPLDIKFTSDGSEAYVSFHGSWDSSNPVGYRIASIAFGSDGQPTANQSSNDAALDVLTNANLTQCPGKCFRPVGLAWDSQGRLWFSSDSTGEVFVLQKGNGTSNTTGADSGKSSGDGSAAAALFPERSAILAVTLAAILAGLLLA